MKRKICIVTGTRADYGIYYPVMKAIKSSKNLELQIVATCMHLMKEFGMTVREIKKEGFKVNKEVDISYSQDTGLAMADSVGRGICGLSKAFSVLKPDLVMVLGDRGEMLAAAIAADYLNIPIAHLHGGEISGHIDGILRHAITKLSHLHFTATESAKKRIIRLGEDPSRVFRVGAPAIDRILKENLPSRAVLEKKYKIGRQEPFLLLVQHPVSTQMSSASRQISATIEAVKSTGIRTIILYPNADAGGREMIRVIKRSAGSNGITAYKSIPHKDYLGLMKSASVLVGNSSSGIIEAPSFRTPVVNIGIRQEGRERAANIINCSDNRSDIRRTLNKALNDKVYKAKIKIRNMTNPYGDGNAAARILKVLEKAHLGLKCFEKKISY